MCIVYVELKVKNINSLDKWPSALTNIWSLANWLYHYIMYSSSSSLGIAVHCSVYYILMYVYIHVYVHVNFICVLASVPALLCMWSVPTYGYCVSLVFDMTIPSLLSLPGHMS